LFSSAPPRLCVRQILTLADKPTSATHFFIWGRARIPKYEDGSGIQSPVFFANFEEPQPHIKIAHADNNAYTFSIYPRHLRDPGFSS
jgi:hypothetical protein